MSYVHRLQGSRYELKYVLDEALVKSLREFSSSYLTPDEHADAARNWEYDVHSLYLDSPTYELCRSTMRGQKNRFKLRIRFYDFSAESPAFFEIKRRVSDVILKRRAKVRRKAVGELLAGHWPERNHLCDPKDDQGFGALEQFCSLRSMLAADGKVFVSYLREAYVTPRDDTVRVTFDRLIRATPHDGRALLDLTGRRGLYPKVKGIVLELKFTDRFPNWMRQMVEIFDLQRVSMAKYVSCVECLAAHPIGPTAERKEVIL